MAWLSMVGFALAVLPICMTPGISFTLVTLLGVAGARAEAQKRAAAAIAALGPYAARSPELSGLPHFLLDREA